MKKKLLIFVFFLIISALVMYGYIYKSHRDISSEKESFAVSVVDLKNDFEKNDSLANAKYLDKTIIIYGKISGLDLTNNILSIDKFLSAKIKEKKTNLKANDSIKLKGRFIGYDDLFEEFKMDECIILE